MGETTRSGYEGVLSQPIDYNVLRTLRYNRTLDSRIDALCLCFGVDPHAVNRTLVLVLARRYVPGFQLGKAKVPLQKKWDDIGLAHLWLLCRDTRPRYTTNQKSLIEICRQTSVRRFAGNVKPIWIQQLLNKARLSPLVQLLESGNPIDNQFAKQFLAKHSRET